MATNVRPEELNYDHYETQKYDDDIIRSIPGHEELHGHIDQIVESFLKQTLPKQPKVLELGVGTGLTAGRILRVLPNSDYTAIDFSEKMLDGARRRLSAYPNVRFVQGDYSVIELPQYNDLVGSVIGIHHQETDADKKRLFRKIYNSLRQDGAFIFGDLVTYRDPAIAALNDALHYHHLVENAQNEESLIDWAHHHKFLNKLAPLEDQMDWLKDVGFRDVELVCQKFNTALIYSRK